MKPRHVTLVLVAAFLGLASFAPGTVRAGTQQPSPMASGDETARGILLYKQGDIKAAINALGAAVKKQKDDADAWFYLGLALNKNNNIGSARKAFEAAIKIRPEFAPAHTALGYTWVLANKLDKATREIDLALALQPHDHEAHYLRAAVYLRQRLHAKALDESNVAISIAPGYAEAFFLRTQALIGLYDEKVRWRSGWSREEYREHRKGSSGSSALIKEASDSLERYLNLKPDLPDKAVWQDQLETMKFYADAPENQFEPFPALADTQGRTRARITQKPEPAYTEEARSAGVSGTIVLKVVFSAEGKVEHILVLQSLPYGLTEKAIAAARKIKFIPASKEGRPVSAFAQLEYTFTVY